MQTKLYRSEEEMLAGLEAVRQAPKEHGRLVMIVRRPQIDAREVLESGELDAEHGLVGDNWKLRGSKRTADGSAHPDKQLNIMNVRAIAMLAQSEADWPLAGDQLFIDLDLSDANLPPGTRLALGSAVIEVTDSPHTGCSKFAERFGPQALKLVNAPEGRALNLRGICARVVQPGSIRTGDVVEKLE